MAISKLDADIAALAELCRTDFVAYCSVMKRAYQVFTHLMLVNAVLADVAAGLITRVIFAMPPRHGKSFTISELFPAFMMGINPGMKVIQASYGDSLAGDFGRSVRDQLQSSLFRDIFGFGLDPGVKAAGHFRTAFGGSYISAGIGGAFIGFGANLFNIDDPIKNREEAESQKYREKIVTWLQSVAYDRLEDFDDGRSGIMMLTATRWHENDLSGWMLRELRDEGYLYVSLPAVSDPFGNPCSPTDAGAIPLWAERRTLEDYQTRKLIVGPYEWESKYQQNPRPPSGSIFDLDWFNRFDQPPAQMKMVNSWDTAQKDKLTSDYTAGGTFGVSGGRYYLTKVQREKLKYPDLKRAVVSEAERSNPVAVLIEDKSSGTSLIQDLRNETSVPVVAIEPEGDKRIRAYAQSGIVEAGLCWLPRSAVGNPWLGDFESEIRSFPTVDNDDQTDMFTQFLKWQRGKGDNLVFASTGSRDSAAREMGGGFATTG